MTWASVESSEVVLSYVFGCELFYLENVCTKIISQFFPIGEAINNNYPQSLTHNLSYILLNNNYLLICLFVF